MMTSLEGYGRRTVWSHSRVRSSEDDIADGQSSVRSSPSHYLLLVVTVVLLLMIVKELVVVIGSSSVITPRPLARVAFSRSDLIT